MNVAGIDVDSRTLKVAIRRTGKSAKPVSFANDAPGHQRVLKALRKAQVERVCLEATGSYHLDLAVVLSESPDLELMVINPKAAKRFAEALGQRQKTDPVDAAMLAEHAERMPFSRWQPPAAPALGLRQLSRRLSALGKQRTQAKNHLHAARASQLTPALVLEDIELTIQQLDEQITRLRRGALDLIEEHQDLEQVFALLVSAKGVADSSAIQIMGELLVLPEVLGAKQWVAMAGLDPRHHRSGSSIEKKPRISKAGNRHLRMALYMPALCAARHEPHVRAYYRHLIEHRGLKKMQAICAIMRKLLHAFHGMLKSRTRFDGSRFCAIPPTATS